MRKEKLERNKEIYRKWKQGKLGYKKLGQHYNLHYTTIQNIIYRHAFRAKTG